MTVTTPDELQHRADEYARAWNSHDLHAIMAMHTPDTVFRLHMLGAPEITGLAQVRGAFAGLLATWPDIHFATRIVQFGPTFLTQHYQVTATLAAPMHIGRAQVEPTGTTITFSGTDTLIFEKGLVQRKETYLDLPDALVQLGVL